MISEGTESIKVSQKIAEMSGDHKTKLEHISNKETALSNMFSILRPGGKLFISYPPKYCAYAGHQQTVSNIFGKIPYIHLLPDFLYKLYLKMINCPSKKFNTWLKQSIQGYQILQCFNYYLK